MKRIISVITVIAVMLTMLVVPASAAVNAQIVEGYNLGTENGGLFGKAADEYAVKWTTPAADTKSPIKVYEANYNFSDSKYIVLDLNVAPLDGATHFSAGPNAGIYSIDGVKAFNKNQWNSVRVVLEEQTKEQMASTGKYQPMTMYVNGVKVGEGAYTLNENDEITGNGTQQYGKGFRFSVHGAAATDVAYVADARLSESDVNEAPVLPSLDASDKYSIEKYGILLNGEVTVADLTAGSNTVKVYKGGELVTDTSALLTEDCEIIVCDNVNKLYKNYAVGVLTVNEWKDYKPAKDADGNVIKDTYEEANTYTWSFSPITATLTIGMVENPVVSAETTYGAILTESWAGEKTTNRPWHIYKDMIEHIAFKEVGDYHFQCLGRQMFDSFSKMKEVTIPRYVKDAQWGVFNNCTALETVIFEEGGHGMEGGFTTLKGMKMFAGCTKLSKVVLSSGFTNLNGGQFFYGCKSLNELFVPASVATISANIFDQCGDVKLITYENSTAAAQIAAQTFTGASITTELIPAKGLIEDAQGNEGSISWKIDADTQTLIISDVADVGTGDMPDKAGDNYQGMFPWNHITGFNKVVVEDGITRTGRWFLMGPKAGAQQSVSIPGTLKSGSVFSFVSLTVNDLIFNEGAEGIFSVGHCINRDCKITNLYLPSTANNIATKWWRGFDGDDSDVYIGHGDVNLYAPLGSDGYKWSKFRAANAKDGVTVNVIANIEAKSFDDENVVITNHGFANETADIIVAYFDGTALKDVVIARDVVLAADSDTNVAAPISADGYKREVFVWNDIANLAPVAINAGE